MNDLLNAITPKVALAPAVLTDDTVQTGNVIDRYGHDSLTFVIATGDITDTDATFAVEVQHGDAPDLSDAAAVPDSDLIGTEALAGFTYADDNACRKIGYKGTKRYVRIVLTPTNLAAANAPVAAVAILGHALSQPTANPPA